MTIQLVVLQETASAERRVALVPQVAQSLLAAGLQIAIQQGAGLAAGFDESAYGEVSWFTKAQIADYLQRADVVFCVQMPSLEILSKLRPLSVLVGLLTPENEAVDSLCQAQVTSFNLAWLPRITRAQSMDVLSSQAAAAGYQAVLLAAQKSPRFFPMLTTAAGTIRPATVLVIGAGVAGLQAIATAKRLGAQVLAYDIRASVKEQVASLGAKMIDLGVNAEGAGGYARELTEQELAQQQQALAVQVARADVVITTAAVPGRRAPVIVTENMVQAMRPGSVVLDMAAESGGNCALTQVGVDRDYQGVLIAGPVNLASQLAQDASLMYSRNLAKFFDLLIQDQHLQIDWQDEILASTQLTLAGQSRATMTSPLLVPTTED